VRTTELTHIDQFSGYRYTTLEKTAQKTVEKTAIILSFSGGGTRAAALADGVLRALSETLVPTPVGAVPLSSQLDLISSVSGGSLTAAYFGLYGVDGLSNLENNFLRKDMMGALFHRVALNPLQLVKPRIDILSGYLDDEIFHHKTYRDLLEVNAPGLGRRPYVVLNASDMANGSVFSFTQDQFDLICGDLTKLKVADAVASSAAFPVALSALTIKTRSPCAAQENASTTAGSGWHRVESHSKAAEYSGGAPEPVRITNDRAVGQATGVNYPEAGNLARFRRGTLALTYLNRERNKEYIQLLDGGIADNLGLTLPLTLLTSPSESPSFLNMLNTNRIDKLLLVVVNARSEGNNDFGRKARPPGVGSMLMASIGTPIDATSFQLLGKLDEIIDDRFNPRSIVLVDFDFIADERCRSYFHNIVTSWALPTEEVNDLIALGRAMVLQSPRYADMVNALKGTMPNAVPSVVEICQKSLSRAGTRSQ
jgi:NTE family protein